MCISLTSEIKASSWIIITAKKGENSFIFELEVVSVVLGGSCEGGGWRSFNSPPPLQRRRRRHRQCLDKGGVARIGTAAEPRVDTFRMTRAKFLSYVILLTLYLATIPTKASQSAERRRRRSSLRIHCITIDFVIHSTLACKIERLFTSSCLL